MIQIIALLYASQNGLKGLREFESIAIPILREHGGQLISASTNLNRSNDEPDEIHVIQFPSAKEFEAYKNDQRIVDLRSFKDSMISKMEVHLTNSFYEYE
jgi:uncharacterized protein (DUF1330 family)